MTPTTSEAARIEASVSLPVPDLDADGLVDLFDEGPRLVGTRCDACGRTMLGDRIVCSDCVGTAVTRVALPATGVLYAFTRLHVGAAGVRALGYVDLAGDVRTLADLREDGQPLQPGLAVEFAVDGDDWYFAPSAGPAASAPAASAPAAADANLHANPHDEVEED
ncbi:Zn-ribbon domain-containing OB-fold protein [Agromyces allii]|uniref:DUF35 domain-containing protein n=1 Tax=Agromyces allii TaxID=393607 RepID=A0ABP5CU32_9MICO|nr:hypothetical protein [Agromyces allii]